MPHNLVSKSSSQLNFDQLNSTKTNGGYIAEHGVNATGSSTFDQTGIDTTQMSTNYENTQNTMTSDDEEDDTSQANNTRQLRESRRYE